MAETPGLTTRRWWTSGSPSNFRRWSGSANGIAWVGDSSSSLALRRGAELPSGVTLALMAQSKKYSLRPGSPALTTPQWAIATVAVIVGLIGFGLMATDESVPGAMLMALAGMILSLLALTNLPPKGGKP